MSYSQYCPELSLARKIEQNTLESSLPPYGLKGSTSSGDDVAQVPSGVPRNYKNTPLKFNEGRTCYGKRGVFCAIISYRICRNWRRQIRLAHTR